MYTHKETTPPTTSATSFTTTRTTTTAKQQPTASVIPIYTDTEILECFLNCEKELVKIPLSPSSTIHLTYRDHRLVFLLSPRRKPQLKRETESKGCSTQLHQLQVFSSF
jgi:hypothetical protein